MPIAEKVRFCKSSQVHINIAYDLFEPTSGNHKATLQKVSSSSSSPETATSSSTEEEEPTTILLVPGLNNQQLGFDVDFIKYFTDAGFRVIRAESRDIGLSSKMDHQGQPWKFTLLLPTMLCPAPAYTLFDMAEDQWSLLDYLKIKSKVVVSGVSMGGMIVSCMNILRPDRVLLLAPMMSSTSHHSLSSPDYWVKLAMLESPASDSKEDFIAYRTEFYLKVCFPLEKNNLEEDRKYCRKIVTAQAERSSYRIGIFRQLTAVFHSPDRTALMSEKIKNKVLVIHGDSDNLMAVDHAHHFKTLMPDITTVEIIKNCGHFLEPRFFQTISGLIIKHAVAG